MNRIAFFVLNYGSALTAGCVQFVAMTLFSRSLHQHDYSLLAWTFGLFPQYQLLIDLGLQSDLIRRFAGSTDQEAKILRTNVIRLRLILAAASLFVFAAQATLSKISLLNGLAAGLFLATLFPASLLYTFEAEGYARSEPFKTLSMRIARLAGFSFCIAVFLMIAQHDESLSTRHLFLLVLTFPMAWTLVLLFSLRRSIRAKKESLFTKTQFQWTQASSLLSSSKEYVIAFALSWGANALFTIGITRQFGQNSLSGYFFAQTLCVPVSLGLQVLSGMTISAFFGTQNRSQKKIKSKYSWFSVWILAGLCAVAYGGILFFTPLINLVTQPMIAIEAKREVVWILGAHFIMTIGGILGVHVFSRGQKAMVWISTASSILVFSLLWILYQNGILSRSSIPTGLDFFATFAAPCFFLAAVTVFTRRPA